MQLENLIARAETVLRDPRYEELREFWNRFYALKEPDRIPIKITLTTAFFARHLGFDLVDHYWKPERYVEDSLRILGFQHEVIPDDRVINGIVLNFGEVFEASLFGSEPFFTSDRDPWIGKPAIKAEEDLENLDYPDFYKSGLMPKVLEVYETAQRMLKDKIPVFFERWDRSPWGIAVHLRGLDRLLKDTVQNQQLVHKLLAFITESRIRWEKEKEAYLGTETVRASLANDEVDARLMSPRAYRTFAYPYEKKLADFYPEGIFYFHSCGDITPFLETIASIRGLGRLHISPATDFKTAVERFGRNLVFEKRVHPVKDLELCGAKTMERRIREILKTGAGTFIELDPGPIESGPIEKIKTWIMVARKTIESHSQ